MSCFDTFLGPVASIRSNLSFARSICNFGASAMIATLVRSDPLVCGRSLPMRNMAYSFLRLTSTITFREAMPLAILLGGCADDDEATFPHCVILPPYLTLGELVMLSESVVQQIQRRRWSDHQQVLPDVETWALRGRLSVTSWPSFV
uniref:AlNc14C339G10767 protein n=2 Tax=Albugo laibachii Nc14 TaxID=890382 RepID=F0WX10_9STRA|nr:AlNc14C339G10767 [Albugo laibachii Nc14]|eukprot:CCA25998.1 AlNc14C339G10767 [Albugo laibachii Nc14]